MPFNVKALELEKSFETSFDYEGYFSYASVITSYNNNGNVDGYIIYLNDDTDMLLKYNLKNEVVWSKVDFVPQDLKTSKNDNKSIMLEKMNLDTNEVIWQQKINSSSCKYFYSYNNSGNIDGYMVSYSISSTEFELDLGSYLAKYDIDGNLIWLKHSGSEYVKSDNGDWLCYDSVSSHAMWTYYIHNLSKGTIEKEIYAGRDFYPFSLITAGTTPSLILIYGNDGVKLTKYTLYGEEILTKDLDSSFNQWLLRAINSKTILGEYDGFIVGGTDAIIKSDYDGNLIWEKRLSYIFNDIFESYDETGEFNGYIVTGYDEGNKKGYITNFTYPKKVIESKSSDVEVISDAYPGKTVTVKAKEKTGYVVKKIVVKDSSGEEIEVSDDGIFVMPDDDASIEVIYEKKAENIITNPKTSSALCVALAIISISLLGTFIVKNRKMRGENL